MMGRETREILPSYRCAPATVVRTFVTLAVPCDQDGLAFYAGMYTLFLHITALSPARRLWPLRPGCFTTPNYVKIGRF